MRRRDVLLATVILLLAWQLLAWLLRLEVLPGPAAVGQALAREIPRGLGRHFLVSGWRVVASIAVATLLAVPAGLILGQSARLNRLVSPIVYILHPIPKIVFLPILLAIPGHRRYFKDIHDLSDPVLPDPGGSAGSGRRAASRVDLFGAVFGRRPPGAVSLRLPAGDGARGADRAARQHRDGGRRALLRRVIRDDLRDWGITSSWRAGDGSPIRRCTREWLR